ncbi:MAG: hypothetical protein CMF59_11670 [Leptospiraceae bacterium]|nr:hypothetical protein [Leptospiraceae bacterium]
MEAFGKCVLAPGGLLEKRALMGMTRKESISISIPGRIRTRGITIQYKLQLDKPALFHFAIQPV